MLPSSSSPHRLGPLPMFPPPPQHQYTTTTLPFLLHHLWHSPSLSVTGQLHARLLRLGFLPSPTPTLALLRSYALLGRPHLAALFLPSLSPDSPTQTFALNLLLRSHTLHSPPHLPLLTLTHLLSSSPPDKFTLPFSLTYSAAARHLPLGRALHALSLKLAPLLPPDIFLHNTLLQMYLSCDSLADARKLFDRIPHRDVVTWNTFLSGLLDHGDIASARDLFEQMPVRNVAPWSAIIRGYARLGPAEEAFVLFRRMRAEGIWPNTFTWVALIVACTELGSVELGRQVHDMLREDGGLDRDGEVYVGTALIDMYSKCGSLEEAVRVFEGMAVRNVATWNAMIASLGVHGRGREAVGVFEEMKKDGSVRPDESTFGGVLRACLRDGLVEEGCLYFKEMTECYGIKPNELHRRCLVELMERKEWDGDGE